MKGKLFQMVGVSFCFMLFLMNVCLPVTSFQEKNGDVLPPPKEVDMVLETAFFRRMSVREFTDESVSDEDLSTVLWAAYGFVDEVNQTVLGVNGLHAIEIYVLKEDAVYIYDPIAHALDLYKTGDYRSEVWWQYEAPMYLCLVWNKSKNADEWLSSIELGMVGQNIQFMVNALNLGTVVTAETPSPIRFIGLPLHHKGRIVMPLGHPLYPYRFLHLPFWVSLLPRIKKSDVLLSDAFRLQQLSSNVSGELSRGEQTQLLWSSYGFSYLVDVSRFEKNPIGRHRTVPSAHGYYPLRVYTVSESGVFRYVPHIVDLDRYGIPVFTFMMRVSGDDVRDEVAAVSDSCVASAPVNIVIVLDRVKTIKWDDLSDDKYLWIWFYEAGASVQNVLLEAGAWELSSNVVFMDDVDVVRSVLGVDENYLPMVICTVGR